MLPSLRYGLARGARSWAVFPIPPPDALAPAESLLRTQDGGGFRLRGVEFEDVSP